MRSSLKLTSSTKLDK
jgi:hypothetical protein